MGCQEGSGSRYLKGCLKSHQNEIAVVITLIVNKLFDVFRDQLGKNLSVGYNKDLFFLLLLLFFFK